MKLHLGCEFKRLPGYVNVDFHSTPAVDKLCDLRERWPWKDNIIEEIYSHHVFEHLPFGHTFTEAYRVLKPGGVLHFRVPHGNTFMHLMNPTHVTHFAWPTFDAWDASQNHSDYGFKMKWRVDYRRIHFLGSTGESWRRLVNMLVNPLINKLPILYERAFMYVLPACEIEYRLIKVQRHEELLNTENTGLTDSTERV